MGEAGINKTAKLVTSEEMRLLEERASQQGIYNAILMETAGLEIALAVSREIGFLRQTPILILVGPGNNGLDGLIAGTHLSSLGAKVTAALLSERISTDTIMTKAAQSGVRILTLSSRNGDESLDLLGDEIKKSIVIVDAIFGIGMNRPIVGYLSKVLATVN